jgi:DNA invertase Pin-like site-specific DNA recombinase
MGRFETKWLSQPQNLAALANLLRRLLDMLDAGDVLTVPRIDRLARSAFDLFGIVKRIVDAKAQFRSLGEPRADTGTSTGRLMIAVLGRLEPTLSAILSAPAPPTAAAGRGSAGSIIGRPPKSTAAQQAEALRRRAEGATLAELARSYNVSLRPDGAKSKGFARWKPR